VQLTKEERVDQFKKPHPPENYVGAKSDLATPKFAGGYPDRPVQVHEAFVKIIHSRIRARHKGASLIGTLHHHHRDLRSEREIR